MLTKDSSMKACRIEIDGNIMFIYLNSDSRLCIVSPSKEYVMNKELQGSLDDYMQFVRVVEKAFRSMIVHSYRHLNLSLLNMIKILELSEEIARNLAYFTLKEQELIRLHK